MSNVIINDPKTRVYRFRNSQVLLSLNDEDYKKAVALYKASWKKGGIPFRGRVESKFSYKHPPTLELLQHLKVGYDQRVWQEYYSIYNAYSKRFSRVRNYINHMAESLSGKEFLVFGTLTFNDDVLASTKDMSRWTSVKRFLEANTLDYIANIDFGKENGREHYHFIAKVDSKIDPEGWSFGYSIFQKVKLGRKSSDCLSRYLLKTALHACKTSGHRVMTPKLHLSASALDGLPF